MYNHQIIKQKHEPHYAAKCHGMIHYRSVLTAGTPSPVSAKCPVCKRQLTFTAKTLLRVLVDQKFPHLWIKPRYAAECCGEFHYRLKLTTGTPNPASAKCPVCKNHLYFTTETLLKAIIYNKI